MWWCVDGLGFFCCCNYVCDIDEFFVWGVVVGVCYFCFVDFVSVVECYDCEFMFVGEGVEVCGVGFVFCECVVGNIFGDVFDDVEVIGVVGVDCVGWIVLCLVDVVEFW